MKKTQSEILIAEDRPFRGKRNTITNQPLLLEVLLHAYG